MLGASLREVWSETWSVMGPQIERVMSGAGATWAEDHLVVIPRFGQREEIYWTYSFSPIDDASAASSVGGVMVLCMETTKKVRAERQLAFQLALSDKLRSLSDASEIMLTAAEMVGRQLGAGRVGYGEIDGIGKSALGRLRLDRAGHGQSRRPVSTHRFRHGAGSRAAKLVASCVWKTPSTIH